MKTTSLQEHLARAAKARWKNKSKAERSEEMRKVVNARWAKAKKEKIKK